MSGVVEDGVVQGSFRVDQNERLGSVQKLSQAVFDHTALTAPARTRTQKVSPLILGPEQNRLLVSVVADE